MLKAYDLAGKDSVTITLETRVRAELFIHQYEVMYGDGPSAIKKLQVIAFSVMLTLQQPRSRVHLCDCLLVLFFGLSS